MTVSQTREVAGEWMVQEGSRLPGFCGAYTAGSTNWLPDDAELPDASDLDIMVILSERNRAGRRGKFVYHGVLLEISYLHADQFESSDQLLSDYHLAPSFRTAKILFDPLGHLAPLQAAVSRDYHKRRWVRQRCHNARDKVLNHLRSIHREAPFPDQMMACLFAAGITSHVLLVAGLRNPTVRARYVAVRELLAEYGHIKFHGTLLELLGCARISRERVTQHVAALAGIFDAATRAIKTSFPFATDISTDARPIAIDASAELIERGYHREAMFWVGVTYSRCQKVLAQDAQADLAKSFKDGYQALVGDLGLATFRDIQRRCAKIESTLPRVCELAEGIIAGNPEISDG